MTSGTGTVFVPKDILFENLLKHKFDNDKFEKILYYDACIIVKDGKRYGKIIICDDSIYSFVDGLNKFTLEALFKDIYSVEMISDIPDFIIGPMKKKNIHIQIRFYKRIPIKVDAPSKSLSNSTKSEFKDGSGNHNNNNFSEPVATITATEQTLDNDILVTDKVDFYIMNIHSAAYHLLTRARLDYSIRQTHCLSGHIVTSSIHISQSELIRRFDTLTLDLTSHRGSMTILKDYLQELLEAGLKYTRIKVLFWAKPALFPFLVSQFTDHVILLVADNVDRATTYSYISFLCFLVDIFNAFFTETDHLLTKGQQLRLDNGKWALALIRFLLSLIGYLNECDEKDEEQLATSGLEVDLDCAKHSLTVSSVQLFYHMICSSQVTLNDHDVDSFNLRIVVHLLESMTSYDSSAGLFNRFVNQCLRMQFIWIFPKVYKFQEQTLTPDRVISVYQFFSAMRAIMQCAPKMMQLLRREMEEEFEHFMLEKVSFPEQYPLSSWTLKLLKSFQRNMLGTKEIFIDYC